MMSFQLTNSGESGQPGAAVASGKTSGERLLIALDESKRKLFLGGMEQRIAALDADVVIIDKVKELDEKALLQLAPSIIVSGWSCPPLPASWVNAEDCSLRYVCHMMGSVRSLVPRSFVERGGLVTNWGSIAAPAVAEHALLLALGALRNCEKWKKAIAKGNSVFTPEFLGTRSLFGRRVGIHGFGNVARSLVELLRPFGVEVIAYTEGVSEEDFVNCGVRCCGSLSELFTHSEILFECEALTPETKGLVDAQLLKLLPDEAIFINVGRGEVVNERALLQEAAGGRIRIALDVVCQEPLLPDNQLCSIEDALLSPHIGGPTMDLYPKIGAFAIGNVERFLSGREPLAKVSLDIYDRTT